VDEGGREHAAAFAAGDQESEARGKRAADFLVVAERDRHRGAVVDVAKIARQVFVRGFQHGRSGVRWSRDDYGVEVVGLVSAETVQPLS